MKKIALITGASGGLGRIITKYFANAGIFTAVHYYNNEEIVEDLCKALNSKGKNAMKFYADLNSSESINAMINSICSQVGNISILINCAGIMSNNMAHKMDIIDWENVININLRGTFFCCRAVIESMQEIGSGRILNITAAGAHKGLVGASNYTASKLGIEGFSRVLAKELAPDKITVNSISIGGYMTGGMLERLPLKTRDELKSQIPLGRWGDPNKLSNLLLALCSQEANYLTGQTLSVDGGFSL